MAWWLLVEQGAESHHQKRAKHTPAQKVPMRKGILLDLSSAALGSLLQQATGGEATTSTRSKEHQEEQKSGWATELGGDIMLPPWAMCNNNSKPQRKFALHC